MLLRGAGAGEVGAKLQVAQQMALVWWLPQLVVVVACLVFKRIDDDRVIAAMGVVKGIIAIMKIIHNGSSSDSTHAE